MGIIAASRLRAATVNPNPFIIEVDTSKTGVSNNNQFQFTGAEGDYDVVAKQNDIVVATFDNLSGAETIILPSSGIYVLEVSAKEVNGFNRIQFNNGGDELKITDIKQWGNIVWSSFERTFFGCENMLVTATDAPNLSNATSMLLMFHTCWLANPKVSNWDVSNITNFNNVFRDCYDFNQPINSWDVSNATIMRGMFESCRSFNQPLNNWDVSNVSEMIRMFRSALSFNQDLSGWCVPLIAAQENNFDDNTPAWVLPNSRPIWGTCP
jgi:surface protein